VKPIRIASSGRLVRKSRRLTVVIRGKVDQSWSTILTSASFSHSSKASTTTRYSRCRWDVPSYNMHRASKRIFMLSLPVERQFAVRSGGETDELMFCALISICFARPWSIYRVRLCSAPVASVLFAPPRGRKFSVRTRPQPRSQRWNPQTRSFGSW